ncbi:hypothetical protein [Cellulomonas soli]|uniref:hypothetical protein n=1 Tax=Cellulomonas soli TaxID=931535 RepID=UPI0011BEEAAF|nr:hypothetical protein [Cellulomonas soli]NYI57805.1 hypothetical protein [Cellulomonas soli]
MIRLLLAASVGALGASVALALLGFDQVPTETAVAVTGSATALFFALVVMVGALAPSAQTSRVLRDLDAADREDRIALAQVLFIRETGTEINDRPLCELRLLVAPRDRDPYTTAARTVVGVLEAARLLPGSVQVVVRANAARPEVVLVPDPPEPWALQARSDTRVRSMTSAPEWVEPPPRGRTRAGLVRIPAVLFVVAALLGAGARAWPERVQLQAWAAGEPRAELVGERASDEYLTVFEPGAARTVADDLVAAAGVSQLTSLSFYGTYAAADALTSPGATTTDSFWWSDGVAERRGPTLIQPTAEGLPAALFDVSTLDLTPVQLLVDQTPALTGIDLAAADVMVLVRRATNAAVTTPTEFAVSVDGDYHDAWITADATGAVVAMEGGAPGSPAALAAQANG